MQTRVERDSLGEVQVPADRLWGAQTQRSLGNFDIGRDRFVMRPEVLHAFGLLKGAAARVNRDLGELDPGIAELIEAAAAEVAAGELDEHFPLVVFQTGSGTQTNMNVNEVIANRANVAAGGALGARAPVHPNDHVNRGQSSNDTFPTAMNVAVVLEVGQRLVPAVGHLRESLAQRSEAIGEVVLSGRTHLQDATPIRLGQVIDSWVSQLDAALDGVAAATAPVRQLAIGGTAVGTGLGAHPEFGARVAELLAALTGEPFAQADDLVAALSSHDALATLSGSLRTLAAAMYKIANDVRWYASGPRTGIGELRIPANEPGSSIMPGKVNPTQSEAVTMVAARVFGNDAAVGFAAAQGNFQLNVFKPVIADAVLESIGLIADAARSFADHCVVGLEPVPDVIEEHLRDNLMLVTALAHEIGYDAASAIAKRAQDDGLSLRDAALASGAVSAEGFDRLVDPRAMTGPRADPAVDTGGASGKDHPTNP
jgi:fumarate hydratase class II